MANNKTSDKFIFRNIQVANLDLRQDKYNTNRFIFARVSNYYSYFCLKIAVSRITVVSIDPAGLRYF